ncbi:MAG: molybdopterin-dependent oxidoreductase [Woeseiaceae bacterium]|nr:molybdopterin-dependent oxidoreductase [Woeseiaceae bacterium]
MKRRDFIKVSTLLGTSAAVSPTFLLGGCSSNPLPGTGTVSATPTICDMCFWKCASHVYQEDGELWKITGNDDDLHSGGRLCTRGTGGPGAYLDPDRLKTPLMRVTVDGRQTFQPVSWDEALDYIADKMRAIAAEHGPEKMLMLNHGSGSSHFRHLLRAYGSDSRAEPAFAQCRGPRDVGFRLTVGESASSPERTDMANARCIVLIGSHIGENLHNGQVQTLAEAINRDATLITVDPRFSVPAGKSQHWLPIKPGTDLALLLSWMHVLIEEDLYDHDYVERYTVGFEQLKDHVRSYTPEWVYLETGIRPEVIRETAREMAKAAPATVVHPGRHATWYGDDTQRSRAIAMLNALLGSWNRKGGFYIPERVSLPEYPLPDYPERRYSTADAYPGKWPFASQGVTNGVIDASVGEDAFFKGWLVYGTNLPQTIPGVEQQLEAAANSLDLLVVVETMPSEMTGYADVILPECTYLERYDELRNSGERQPSLALRMPAFEPKYESKPGWWMAKQLGHRLGLDEYFPWEDFSEKLDWQLQQVGSSLEEMQKIGVKNFPRKTPLYFREGTRPRFRTPSRKIELYSRQLADKGFDPMPVYTPPDPVPEGFYRLNYGRMPAHTFGKTTNNPLLFELAPENQLWVNPLVANEWGFRSGDYVRLGSPNGVVSNRIRVRVTERIGPDSVFMAHGFGRKSRRLKLAFGVGADDSTLMSNIKIDPLMGGTGMRANFVTFVREASAGAAS